MKKRSITITVLGVAAAFLCNAALVFADEKVGSKEQLVAKYALREMNEKIKVAEVTLEFLFEGGSYYIRTSQSASRYTYYAIGCQDGNGSWYLWSNAGWTAAAANSPALTLLKNVRTTVRGNGNHKTVVDKQISDNRVQTYGYEIEIPDAAVQMNCAVRNESLQKIGDDGKARLKEVLSDGSGVPTDAEGISGDIVIALYRDSGTGDGIVFKRKSGLFSGESSLFNRSEYRSYSYTEKALALFYQFFVSKNQQQLFDEFITKHYGVELNVNRTLFASLTADEKKDIFSKLTAVLSNGLTETFRQTVNGKSVFGNAKGSGIARFLYGDKRNVYVDTYLALCYEQFRPVFSSLVREQQKPKAYDPTMYTRISVDDGKELAEAAMRYYTWGVEYTARSVDDTKSNTLFEGDSHFSELSSYNTNTKTWNIPWFTVNTTRTQNYWNGSLYPLSSIPTQKSETKPTVTVPLSGVSGNGYRVPFAGGTAGYPLPYAKNGIDSPRTFAYKMYEQLRARVANAPGKAEPTTTKAVIDLRNRTTPTFTDYLLNAANGYKTFLPGGSQGTLNETGVDTIGLLSGSVSMTSFYDRVYDLGSSRPAIDLDGYFAMASAGVGRGADGKPSYAKTRQDWSGLVLEPEDLEKCSVVIPDLSNLQLGDLIVRFGDTASNRPTEVGIVVGFTGSLPTIQTDQRAFMEKVLVVSVRPGFRQVTLGRWGNPESGFGGFTKDSESCHARRLLKRTEIGADVNNTIANWDLTDKAPATFELTVTTMKEQAWTGAATVKDRWIPNTGEYLLFTDARLSATALGGAKLDPRTIDPGDLELFVAGADDRGYDVNKSVGTHGNVYCNSSASFEVALVPKISGQAVKLGTLVKSVDKEWSYTLNCAGSQLYDETSRKNKAGTSELFLKNRLWLEPDGRIIGLVNGEEYILGVRPANSANAKPGDDLLLKIGIRKRGESEAIAYSLTDAQNGTMSVSAVATMKEADYVAVYDKKLLWRANLYIDEGAPDWNNLHPWNAPAPGETQVRNAKGELKPVAEVIAWWSADRGYNEWNVPDGSNSDVPAGGQVFRIKQWTHWLGGSVTSSVAYGWGCEDGAPDFNRYMTREADIIQNARDETKADQFVLRDGYSKLGWQNTPSARTLAPAGDWINYIFPGRKATVFDGKAYFDYAATDASSPGDQLPNYAKDTYGKRPVIPGLSTVHSDFSDMEYFSKYKGWHWNASQSARTAGTDCSGFVSTAANYTGSQYLLKSHIGTSALDGYGRLIQDVVVDATPEAILPNLEFAVPGDILNNGIQGHVVIISKIIPKEKGIVTNRGQIQIIQAGPGHYKDLYQVIGSLPWDKDSGMGETFFQKYKLLRLK